MSNLQNEQCMEDAFEEIVEDNITKRDLVGVLEITLQRLFIEIKAEESDKLVRSFSMYLHKFITNKVKEVDENAKAKADKCYEDWYNAQCEHDPSDNYDGYHLEDLSDMDREEPCI